MDLASSSKRRPVRRDLMSELGEARKSADVRKPTKPSTHEWVRKAFGKGFSRREEKGIGEKKDTQMSSSEKEAPGNRAPWYKVSEKDAAVAKEIYAQNDKWVRTEEDQRRRREMTDTTEMEPKRVSDKKPEAEQRRNSDQAVPPKAAAESLKPTRRNCVETKGNGLEIQKAQEGIMLGLQTNLDAKEVMSPLKEFVVKAKQDMRNGPRGGPRILNKEPRRIKKRISKALGVKKKIEHSSFRGCHIHKHASLAREDPVIGDYALNGNVFPSSSKTGPEGGQTSKKFKDPVVMGKPPAGA
ncbi:unnamed protein product [Arabis nemorensis]|uniref:Uncharacterized protein n=1 Tax=Arabis nemorensis TaxID=586526 RepID=A0A565BBV8_9BRAS|nr:unnamed protein product [Arabis nemorensis]